MGSGTLQGSWSCSKGAVQEGKKDPFLFFYLSYSGESALIWNVVLSFVQ